MQSVAPEPSFGSFQRIDNVDGQTLPRHRSSVVRVLPFVGLSALSGLLFGYDMCIIGAALDPIREDFDLTTPEKEAIVSVVMAGAVIGALFGGPLCDAVGRRPSISSCGLLFAIGSAVMAAGHTYAVVVAGRLLMGTAIGWSGFAVAVYVTEVSPSEHRGFLVALNELSLCAGCLIAFLAGWLLNGHWRWMVGAPVPLALTLSAGSLWLPESPRWLVMKKRLHLAEVNLMRLKGIGQEEASADVAKMSADLSATSGRGDGGLRELFGQCVSSPSVRWGVLLAVCAGAAQNLVFSNAVLYYGKDLIVLAGVDYPGPISILLGLAKFAGVFASLFVIDKFNRRSILSVGTACQLLSIVIVGIGFYRSSPTNRSASSKGVVVAGLFGFVFAWDISWAPLMWTIVAEVAPSKFRGLGTAIGIAAFWASSVLTNQFLWTMVERLTPSGACGVVAGTSILALVFVKYMLPETKGLTLEQLAALQRQSSRPPAGTDNDEASLTLSPQEIEMP